MKKIFSAVLLSSAVLAMSCNNGSANSQEDSLSQDSIYPPVESNKGNTAYKPAFEGQTRVAGVKTTTSYESKVIAQGLKSPWGIVTLPDGRFLVTEKEGTMRIVAADGSTISDAITGLPKVDAVGQGGLLGLTLDPNFSSNRLVYWTFTHRVDKGNLTAAAKGRLSDDEKTIEGATIIYQAGPVFDGKLHMVDVLFSIKLEIYWYQ